MRIKSRHRLYLAALAALVVGVARADAQSPELAASFARATTALYEMINVPDGNGIPREALAKAHAVAVFPGVVKGALLIGGTSGDGVVTAHRADGAWSPPAIFRMSGGSLGLQIGAEITDVVLLIMTPKGLQGLLSSEFTIGADMSAAAGPTGRALGAVHGPQVHDRPRDVLADQGSLRRPLVQRGQRARCRRLEPLALRARLHGAGDPARYPAGDPAGRAGIHPDGRRLRWTCRQQAVAPAFAAPGRPRALGSPGVISPAPQPDARRGVS